MNRLTFSRSSFRSNLRGSVLFFLLAGSFFWIYAQPFAIGTVLAFAIGPLIFATHLRNRGFRKQEVGMVAVLALFCVLMAIGTMLSSSESNIRYLKAFFLNFFSFFVVRNLVESNDGSISKGFFAFLAFIILIGGAQITYVSFGFGLDPTRLDAADYELNDIYRYSGIRSIFPNPNDFSLICTLSLIFVCYGISLGSKTRAMTIALLFAMILLAASRTCIVAAVAILLVYYTSNVRRSIILIALISVLTILAASGTDLMLGSADASYWRIRLDSISSIATDLYRNGYSSISDGSIDLRTSGYLQFASKFLEVGFGSFEAADYGYFFKRGDLIDQNPHSLLIELSLLFGYFGFLASLYLFYWFYSMLRTAMKNRGTAIFLTSLVFALSFVSSSVINFNSFWVLIYLIAAGVHQRQEPNLSQQRLRISASASKVL